jgi:uncharacterized membrane protein (DUF485 family)
MPAPTTPPAATGDHAIRFKQRFGILLCAIYALVYASFVAISVYDVTLMDTLMPFGLNLAIFYGLGLIVFALLLAMIYSRACAAKEKSGALIAGQESAASSDSVQEGADS